MRRLRWQAANEDVHDGAPCDIAGTRRTFQVGDKDEGGDPATKVEGRKGRLDVKEDNEVKQSRR